MSKNTYLRMTKSKSPSWEASKEDVDFLGNLNKELGMLDFYYEYSSDSYVHNHHWHNQKAILDKIKGIEDKDLQEVAIGLYDMHSFKHDGKLSVNWDLFLGS